MPSFATERWKRLEPKVAAWAEYYKVVRKTDAGDALEDVQQRLLTLKHAYQMESFDENRDAAYWKKRADWLAFAIACCEFPQSASELSEFSDEWKRAAVAAARWTAAVVRWKASRKGGAAPVFNPDVQRSPVHQPKFRRNISGMDACSMDLVKFAQAHDLLVRVRDDGVVYCKCPWAEVHHFHSPETGRLLPPRENDTHPTWHCHHANCESNNHWSDLVDLFGADDIAKFCTLPLADQRKAVGDDLECAWPDLVVPTGWALTAAGVFRSGDKGDVPVCLAPMLLSGLVNDVDGRKEYVEVAAFWNGRWVTKMVSRSTMSSGKVAELADQGFPVTSNNARMVVEYLTAFEAANRNLLVRKRATSQMGWQPNGEFVVGKSTVLLDGTVVEKGIEFSGDDGAGVLSDGFCSRGDWETWKNLVADVADHPKAMVAVYSALVPPMLKIFDCPNFVIEWAGETSKGKTTALKLAASVWGTPDARKSGSVMHTWDATTVGIERMAAALRDLPLLLDDTQRARRPEDITKVVYEICGGAGRTRGSTSGMRETMHWRTVMHSTGEQPIGAFSAGSGGDKARVLQLWGSPFSGPSAQGLVSAIQCLIDDNCGSAGVRFLQYLQMHREQWPVWREEYLAVSLEKAAQASTDIGRRLASYFAAIVVTARLAHKALELEGDPEKILHTVWTSIVSEMKDTDRPLAALRDLYDWAVCNRNSFWQENCDSSPTSGWVGLWTPNTGIYFTSVKLKEVLTKLSYPPEQIVRAWKDRHWLTGAPDGRGHQVKIASANTRCWKIEPQALKQFVLDDCEIDVSHERHKQLFAKQAAFVAPKLEAA